MATPARKFPWMAPAREEAMLKQAEKGRRFQQRETLRALAPQLRRLAWLDQLKSELRDIQRAYDNLQH